MESLPSKKSLRRKKALQITRIAAKGSSLNSLDTICRPDRSAIEKNSNKPFRKKKETFLKKYTIN